MDKSDETTASVSAYTLDLTGRLPRISHVGVLPKMATAFSVTPNGDLLITFEGSEQAPIRLTKGGQFSFACGPTPPLNPTRAPR